MKVYNKLVRDRIPQILGEKGVKYEARRLDVVEFQDALVEKLKEELNEYLEAKNPEELADLLEVIYTLAAVQGYGFRKLEEVRIKKSLTNGLFRDRVFLIKADKRKE
jgi:predicted house-cleaning noncanonical NTP pyrophosphatase (MazG superfamily)